LVLRGDRRDFDQINSSPEMIGSKAHAIRWGTNNASHGIVLESLKTRGAGIQKIPNAMSMQPRAFAIEIQRRCM
jgi:hypothetical protein